MNQRLVGKTMEPVPHHSLLVITRRQWEACCDLRQSSVERRVKACDVRCVGKTLLRLPDQFDRRRNMQRSEMGRKLQFTHHRCRDRLVFAQVRASVNNAMAHCYWLNTHAVLYNFCKLSQRIVLRFHHVVLRSELLSSCRANLDRSVCTPYAFSAAIQDYLFVALAPSIQPELQRRRPAVENNNVALV